MFSQALMILAIAIVVSVEIYAIVMVARSSLRKKWAWILLALLGVTQLSMVWGTGPVGYSPFTASLLGFSALKHGTGPWIVTVSFPIGAILAIRKVRAEVDGAETEEVEAVEVVAAGRGDHAV